MATPTVSLRFPIFTFSCVGLFLFILNYWLIAGVMSRATTQPLPVFVVVLLNLIGPGLWLLALALGIFLSAGSIRPPWLQNRWLLAIAAFFILHVPINFLPRPTLFGRWGFIVYAFLGALGIVAALGLLTGRFHIAALLILVEAIASPLTRARFPAPARVPVTALFSVISFALIGWWFRDAAATTGSKSSTQGAPTS